MIFSSILAQCLSFDMSGTPVTWKSGGIFSSIQFPTLLLLVSLRSLAADHLSRFPFQRRLNQLVDDVSTNVLNFRPCLSRLIAGFATWVSSRFQVVRPFEIFVFRHQLREFRRRVLRNAGIS
jgi:hypothetical protein